MSALGNIGPKLEDNKQVPSIVEALTAALEDEDADVRLESMNALSEFGPIAESAIPTLIKVDLEHISRVTTLKDIL